MSASLWHRFPARDMERLVRTCTRLLEAQPALLDDAEANRVQTLVDAIRRGFTAKQDLDLDMDLLAGCIQFALVMGVADGEEAVRTILKNIHAYQRRTPRAEHSGG